MEPNRNRTSFSRQQAYKGGHSSPVPSALSSSKKRGKSVVDVVNQHRIFLWISRGKTEQQTWRLALKSACSPTPSRDVCSSTDNTFTSKNIAKALDESFVLFSRTDVLVSRSQTLSRGEKESGYARLRMFTSDARNLFLFHNVRQSKYIYKVRDI